MAYRVINECKYTGTISSKVLFGGYKRWNWGRMSFKFVSISFLFIAAMISFNVYVLYYSVLLTNWEFIEPKLLRADKIEYTKRYEFKSKILIKLITRTKFKALLSLFWLTLI